MIYKNAQVELAHLITTAYNKNFALFAIENLITLKNLQKWIQTNTHIMETVLLKNLNS